MIGLTRTPGYLQLSTRIAPGDVLVATTDGVLEARDRRGELFEEEGVLAALAETGAASAEEMAASVMSAVGQFTRQPGTDDAIVSVLRRTAG